jgi:hypothetical protein
MPCNPLTNLSGCLGAGAGGQPGTQSAPGWDAICQSFARAAQQLLGSFAKSFVSIPEVTLSYTGVRSVYGLSLEIAALIAAALLMVQVIRTVATHDGSAIAHGLVGIGKAVLAFLLTLGAVATLLRAADEVTRWIVTRSFGSPAALSGRLARLASLDPSVAPSLLLILSLLSIGVTIALWGQLLLRSVAVTLLVAVSPVAAGGQVAQSTQMWWRKLVRVTLQLVVLKPVVALVFAIGLTLPAAGDHLQKLLTDMLVLLLAGCAWPALARLSSVIEVHVGGGVLTGSRGGPGGPAARLPGGPPAGVVPGELSRVAEARTMAAVREHHSRTAETARGALLGARAPAQLTARIDAGQLPRGGVAADLRGVPVTGPALAPGLAGGQDPAGPPDSAGPQESAATPEPAGTPAPGRSR